MSGAVVVPSPERPKPTRVVFFIDGQNLYHRSKECFGPGWVHPMKLAQHMIAEDLAQKGAADRVLAQVRYYTGIHNRSRRPEQAETTQRRLAAWQADGCYTESIRLRYDNDGRAREKGIDVRIALDLIRLARKGLYDVAVIVSEDSDLDEAARDVLELRDHERWIAVENVLPWSEQRRPRWLPSVARHRPFKEDVFHATLDSRDFSLPATGKRKQLSLDDVPPGATRG